MKNARITLQRTNSILYCRYWRETVYFYKKQLCFPVVFENDWFIEFQLTSTSFLSIANSARASITDVQGQGVTLTFEVTDLEKVKERLEMEAIATTTIRHKWNALVFYCQDPEGHRLEFWTNDSKEMVV